jgi:hypothetical protein
MKQFWVIVVIAVAALLAAACILLPSGLRLHQPAIPRVVSGHIVTAMLVVVIWAILFRPQVERFRFSLFSLFVLAAMESILFCAIRLLRPF